MKFAEPQILRLAPLVLMLVGAGLACSRERKAQSHTVAISAFRFEPAVLRVAAGDTVVWDNRDLVPHTATADNRWDSGNIPQLAKEMTIALGEGEQPYTCLYHPNMKGTLVVD